MMNTKKILHAVPDSVSIQSKIYLGSTKDIRGRTEYFKARHVSFDELLVKDRSDSYLLEMAKQMDLSQYRAIIFELALYPETMKYIRKYFPGIKIITRSINADFYHWLHYFWASRKYSVTPKKKIKGNLQYLRIAFDRLKLDLICSRLSDYMLSIVDWEKENYWKFLVSPNKIRTLPYFLPKIYEIDSVGTNKKEQCVCLMSTTAGTIPVLQDALMNFNHLVGRLGTSNPEWSFFVTGDMSRMKITYSPRIALTGFLQSPFPLLMESRGMALLSNFGFGFKTKILDAVQAGCYVFVPEKLYNRLPKEVKPFCVVVDLDSVESFKHALEYTKLPFPDGDPNASLRERAFSVLDELLLQ
jgi:hypothetical protein